MDTARKAQDSVEYVEYLVPARRLAGTQAEVLDQLDQVIQGMVGLRQLVSLHQSDPPKAQRKREMRLVENGG